LQRLGAVGTGDGQRARGGRNHSLYPLRLDRGAAGDRLDLEVALAPCIVGYAVIAAERIGDPATRLEGNSYREWLEMYAGSDYQELAREAAAALDEQFARRGGEGRFSSLAGAFAAAARLEADFWQMGLEAKL